MTQRLCPRCHNVLQPADDLSLVYCGHCGAPQVRLSEEMREQAEQQAAAAASASLDPNLPASRTPADRVTDPASVVWPGAIQCAGLAAGVTAALTLVSSALPIVIVSLLGLFWGFAAPTVVLGIYASRFPRTRIQTGFGFRLGLLSGLAISLAWGTIHIVSLVLQRFVLHSNLSQLDQAFDQSRASFVARVGTADAQPVLRWLDIPEFRAGFVLTGLGMMLALYLLYSSLAGAFAGYLRARHRPPS